MISTFLQLLAAPASRKITLCEITVGEQINAAWTLYSGNIYSITFGRDDITLPGGLVQTLTEEVSALKVNGVAYLPVSSTAALAASYTYWHAGQTLYVNFGGGSPTTDPSLSMVVAYFPLRFATAAISLDIPGLGPRPFDPYLDRPPGVGNVTNQLLGGYSTFTIGEVRLLNGTGLFDGILHTYIWENSAVHIRIGGEDLPYSEYRLAFDGHIITKQWSRKAVTFKLRSKAEKLTQPIASATFNLTDYPNMDPNIKGALLPAAFGTFDQRRSVPVSAIDEAANIATDTVKFKAAGHAIHSITGVDVSYTGGATWTACALSGVNPPAAANQYYASAAELAAGDLYVRFTAGTYVPSTGLRPLVRVALKGKKKADGSVMEIPADVAQDLLTTYAGFVAAEIAAAEIAASVENSEAKYARYISESTRIIDLIDDICRSDKAAFFSNLAGMFVYRTFVPSRSAGSPELTDADLLDIAVDYRKEDHAPLVRVAYARANTGNRMPLYAISADADSVNRFGNPASALVETSISGDAEADTLAMREVLMRRYPPARVSGKVKLQLAEKNIGDLVSITTSRAPYTGGKYAQFTIMLTKLNLEIGAGDTVFEGFGLPLDVSGINVCTLTDDAAADYAVATAAERQANGYLTDDADCVVPGDYTTRNSRLW